MYVLNCVFILKPEQDFVVECVFSVLQGIQMTATTPSMRAVRFETGCIELELSNRVQCKTSPTGSNYLKLFGKCQVDLNLALGQIVKHQVRSGAQVSKSDLLQSAWYHLFVVVSCRCMKRPDQTSTRWRTSALESACVTLYRKRSVAVLIKRRSWLLSTVQSFLPSQWLLTEVSPRVVSFWLLFDVSRFIIVYLCVVAVLFWLNYKAAYDNWKEQRLALNSDIHMATKEVVDKLPAIQQTSAQAFSTLFLQLTVNDLGICLPITSATPVICAHRKTPLTSQYS